MAMARTLNNTKQALMTAMMRVVAQRGLEAATIGAIALEVGVTQGAIYRHYRSKEQLQWCAYKQAIEAMIHEKETLAGSGLPFGEKIREWVRLTYHCYDQDRYAFTYVLLTDHPQLHGLDEEGITTRQGQLFMEMFAAAQKAGLARQIPPKLALSHFTGLMLNVPRLINEGLLTGPAVGFADEVTQSIVWVLGIGRG